MDHQSDSGTSNKKGSRSGKGKSQSKQVAATRATKSNKHGTISWKDGQLKLVLEHEEERAIREEARKKAKAQEGRPSTPRRRSSRLMSMKAKQRSENNENGEMTLIVMSSSSSEGEMIVEEKGEVSWGEDLF